jgi:CheY-like chemotaxis protein
MIKKLNYILIAEDDEDDQLLLLSAFREISHDSELVFVGNGIELLDYFRKIDEGQVAGLPSLLIVDLNMPKKNGREAIKELLDKEYFDKFPTIIFSTTGNELERSRCRDLGIHDFYVKPSNFQSLKQIVVTFRQKAGLMN